MVRASSILTLTCLACVGLHFSESLTVLSTPYVFETTKRSAIAQLTPLHRARQPGYAVCEWLDMHDYIHKLSYELQDDDQYPDNEDPCVDEWIPLPITLSCKCGTRLCAILCITITSPKLAQIEAIYPCDLQQSELSQILRLLQTATSAYWNTIEVDRSTMDVFTPVSLLCIGSADGC